MTDEFLAAYAKHREELIRVMTAFNNDANLDASQKCVDASGGEITLEGCAITFMPYLIGYMTSREIYDFDAQFAVKMMISGAIRGQEHHKGAMQ